MAQGPDDLLRGVALGAYAVFSRGTAHESEARVTGKILLEGAEGRLKAEYVEGAVLVTLVKGGMLTRIQVDVEARDEETSSREG